LKEIRKETNKGRDPVRIGNGDVEQTLVRGDVEQTLVRYLQIEIRERGF
jgi:hypothetical protein